MCVGCSLDEVFTCSINSNRQESYAGEKLFIISTM